MQLSISDLLKLVALSALPLALISTIAGAGPDRVTYFEALLVSAVMFGPPYLAIGLLILFPRSRTRSRWVRRLLLGWGCFILTPLFVYAVLILGDRANLFALIFPLPFLLYAVIARYIARRECPACGSFDPSHPPGRPSLGSDPSHSCDHAPPPNDVPVAAAPASSSPSF